MGVFKISLIQGFIQTDWSENILTSLDIVFSLKLLSVLVFSFPVLLIVINYTFFSLPEQKIVQIFVTESSPDP